MNQKKLITILATITIIAILSVSSFTQIAVSTATTYNAAKMTVNGVLASDSYVLFPYDKSNLIVGFSKYGELINGEVGQANGQGLEYKGLDVFANPHVLEEDWSQGWLIDIHYASKENVYKNVWAFAMYTDLSGSTGIGGDWQHCTGGPLDAPHGGRKTNAWATTDPIKVLYDGPRQFVALTNTTIYEDSLKTKALVSVTITFVFDKDKKIVILFKDIKRLDKGKWGRTFQVEFSNRGQWDIGTTSSPPSYAHFYDNLTTVYNYEYHDFYNATYNAAGFDMCQMINTAGTYVGFAAFWPQLFGKIVDGTKHITPDDVLSGLCTQVYNRTWLQLRSPSDRNITFSQHLWPTADFYPRGDGLWSDEPMVFKNGILLSRGAGVNQYTWCGTNDTIVLGSEPLDTDYITVVYKHHVPDGGGADDMVDHVTEPKTPYVIGEWCFDLKDEDYCRQFRAVTVYGLTDRHDGDDDDTVAADKIAAGGWSRGADVIDCEVQYYLNETFNPYDLYSAVDKQESRWLYDKLSLDTATSSIVLTAGLDDQLYYAVMPSEYLSLGATAPTWTGYFIREEHTGGANSTWVNTFQNGTGVAHSKNWALKMKGPSNGYEMLKVTPQATTGTTSAPLTLKLKDLVDFDFWYKFISGTQAPHIQIKVYNSSAGGETGNKWANIMAENTNTQQSTSAWTHYTLNTIGDFIDGHNPDTAFCLTGNSGGLPNSTFHSFEYWTSLLGEYYVGSVGIQVNAGNLAYVDDLSVGYLNKTSGIRYERVYNMEENKLIPSDWNDYCSSAERVLINGTLIKRYGYNATDYEPYYVINFESGTITFWHWSSSDHWHLWVLPIGTHVKVLYSTIEENEKGRYEWMVVGKDAASIDAIGAAYMTEAFDSKKDIEVLMTGLDINETVHGPYAPFVMSRATTGTRTDYRDALGRTFLRDDWCTTYPVSSSDMLFSGGPLANLGAEYFNEFTKAFWARTEYVVNNTGQAGKIFALSCWSRNTYGAGYAVISVYKDLNGTIGFLIWGTTGQDTYYACKWFWSIPDGIEAPDGTIVYSGIEYLQHENLGVTDIVLEITYPTIYPIHPTVSIVERLGTISEKVPHSDP
jgi:hypothetical protein